MLKTANHSEYRDDQTQTVDDDLTHNSTSFDSMIRKLTKCQKISKERANHSPKIDSAIVDNKDYFDKSSVTDISFNNTSIKDDLMSMEAPIFSISKNPDTQIRSWSSANGLNKVTVIPSVLGRATIYDKDILIYIITCLIDRKNQGLPITNTVQFHPSDYFITCGGGTGGRHYVELQKALGRLNGTQIKTNIKSNNIEITESFHLIERFKLIKINSKVLTVEVTLSDWLFNGVQGLNVLTLNPDYFKLKSASEKRLYEIARKHTGSKASWSIGINLLLDRVGSQGSIKDFNRLLREIIKRDAIPDYRIKINHSSIELYQKDPNKYLAALNKKK